MLFRAINVYLVSFQLAMKSGSSSMKENARVVICKTKSYCLLWAKSLHMVCGRSPWMVEVAMNFKIHLNRR